MQVSRYVVHNEDKTLFMTGVHSFGSFAKAKFWHRAADAERAAKGVNPNNKYPTSYPDSIGEVQVSEIIVTME